MGAAVLLSSCANPRPPSGGPRDETPPSVLATTPARNAVNVPTDTREVRIDFSEYVERTSLAQALSITPPMEGRPEFDWDGRSVTIELPEALRDSTTYIIALDANLSDTRNVSLESPLTFAFATGPRIDQGTVRGRIIEPRTGQTRSRVDVFAYPVPADAKAPPTPLPEPIYRTQTGDDGTFTFEYLREQSYFVLAFRDNNRNRTLDSTEAFALPPVTALRVDSAATEVLLPWVLDLPDRTPPTLARIRPVTSARIRLRFREPVILNDRTPAAWKLRDSTTQADVPVRAVFQTPSDSSEVVLRTSPMQAQPHRLVIADSAVTDTLGRPVRADTVRFVAESLPDTLRTRFRTFLPADLPTDSLGVYRMLPGMMPGFRISQAPTGDLVDRALTVQDTTGAGRAFAVSSSNGTDYRIVPADSLPPGTVLELRLRGDLLGTPDTTYVRRFRRVANDVLGELEGRAVVSDTSLFGTFTPTEEEGPEGERGQRRTQPSRESGLRDALETAPRPGLDTVRTDPRRTRRDTLQAPTPNDTVQADSLRMETVRTDSVAADTAAADTSDSTAVDIRVGDLLRGALSDSLRNAPIVVEMYPVTSDFPVERRTLRTPADSTFILDALPDGEFRFRAFLDRNGNGRWDAGQLLPYTPAEPITWSEQPAKTRPRWTTVLPAPLRLLYVPAQARQE